MHISAMQRCVKTAITAHVAINDRSLRSNPRVDCYVVNEQVPPRECDSYIDTLGLQLYEAQIIQ